MTGSIQTLRQRVRQLEKLGVKAGLSQDDVKRCVDRALLAQLEAPGASSGRKKGGSGGKLKMEGGIKLQTTHPNATSQMSQRTLCRKLLMASLCFALLGCCLLAVCVQSKSVRGFLMRKALPYVNSVVRLIRLRTLPIHDSFNISYYHNERCLVKNPYFTEPDYADCMSCDGIMSVKEFDGSSVIDISQLTQPLLLKNFLPKPVGMREIKEVIHKHAARIDVPMLRWKSSVPWMESPLGLLDSGREEKIAASPEFYLQWTSPSLAVSFCLRRLFPRSSKFARTIEMSLDKTVILHGSAAKPFFLAKEFAGFGVYVQGKGRSRVHLQPPKKCRRECLLLDEFLEEGDMLIYMMDTYRAEIFPQGTGIHVGFLTYIM